jgi:stress-induced morphogen
MLRLLEEHFNPLFIELVDVSSAHRGHGEMVSSDGSFKTETHFKLRIQSPLLKGLSGVAQHQKIYKVLTPYFEVRGLHALTIQVLPCP